MGTRGPAPKREAQRRRANKPDRPVEQITGAALSPELNLDAVHPLAADLYESLRRSPEADFLTPAAWQRARVSAHQLSRLLLADKPSAVMYAALQQDWKSLLIDPGELRRLSIEVRRLDRSDPDEDSAVAALDDYRAARAR